MKLAVVVPTLGKTSPIVGAYLFARYLHHQSDVEPAIVTLGPPPRGQDSLLRQAALDGIATECLGMERWWDLVSTGGARRLLETEGIDAIVSYLIRPDILNSRLEGALRIGFLRGLVRSDYALRYGSVAGNLLASVHSAALRKVDHVFAMSEGMSAYLVDEGIAPDRISVHYNCIDVEATVELSAAGGPDSIDRQATNIGFFASLIPRKRPDRVLESVATLTARFGRHLHLHVCGDGPMRGRLERRARDLGIETAVTFHGFLDNPLPLMRRMDVVVSASESEGLPRTVMEAMALGRTCVGPDIPGIRDLIEHGRTGYLFSSNSEGSDLTAVLGDIVKEGSLLPEDRLRNVVSEKCDVSVRCSAMLHEINRLADAARS